MVRLYCVDSVSSVAPIVQFSFLFLVCIYEAVLAFISIVGKVKHLAKRVTIVIWIGIFTGHLAYHSIS